jgi:hypothetical protein
MKRAEKLMQLSLAWPRRPPLRWPPVAPRRSA